MAGPAGPIAPVVPVLPAAPAPTEPAASRAVFRRATPLVIWWVWVAFAALNIAQVVIPDHNYFSLELTAGLLAVTAVAYACALRPRVVADAGAVRVHNPYRDHLVPWGAIRGVYLGDSVELHCARAAPLQDKTLYCWALYSGRRSRLVAQQRAARDRARTARAGQDGGYGFTRTGLGFVSLSVPAPVSSRAPAAAQELARRDPAQLMAGELARRSEDARRFGTPDGVLSSDWAWLPIVCTLVPAAALLGLALAR